MILKKYRAVVFLGIFLAIMPVVLQAASLVTSGRVAFLRGKVIATSSTTGEERVLKRDLRVHSGDVIKTGAKGLVQIVFPDQSMFYIKANSEVKLSQYRYLKKNPNKDAIVTEVLKGSMRALTGIVGKRNPDKVKFKTKVATIGIRGTALEIHEDQVIFDYGKGYMENAAGSTSVGRGESAKTKSLDVAATKSKFKRQDTDAASIALALIEAPDAEVEKRAGDICKTLEFEEAQLLIGMEAQVPGFKPEVLTSTVKGLIVCIPPDQFLTLLTTSALVHTEYTPLLLKSAVDSKIPVADATKAILRGLEKPPQALLTTVINKAIDNGLTKEEAVKIINEVKKDPFCNL